jgi:hypothetical protein
VDSLALAKRRKRLTGGQNLVETKQALLGWFPVWLKYAAAAAASLHKENKREG